MNLKDSYLHGTDSQALIRALKWENGVLKYQEASESQPWKEITGFTSGNYLPLSGGVMSGHIVLPTNIYISNGSTADGFGMLFWNGTDTVLGSTHGNTIIRNSSGALKHRVGLNTANDYDILDSGNSSVSLAGQTLSVKINGTTQSLTNTWRGIQDNLISTSTTDSLSAKQGKILNDKFNNYLPLIGGTVTGATTFEQAINADILGNATSANRLSNPVNIAISGAITGNANFDGSGNITIATAVSHSHSYVNTIGTSGNTLTWSINGTAQTAITIPYATTAGSVDWGSIDNKPTEFTATAHDHSRLLATDSRAIKPNGTSIHNVAAIKPYFVQNSNFTIIGRFDNTGAYSDALVLDTYADQTGGKPNIILFNKGNGDIYHGIASDWNDSSWEYLYKILDTKNTYIANDKLYLNGVELGVLELSQLTVSGQANFSSGINGNLNGNASTATLLQNPRTITIGSQSYTFNGGSDLTFTLANIGATVSNTWTDGTTAGPTISTTVNGVTGTATIPAASSSASGIVTIGAQTFAGNKTFIGPLTASNTAYGAITVVRNGSTDAAAIKFANGTNGTTDLGSLGINTANAKFKRYNAGATQSWDILDSSDTEVTGNDGGDTWGSSITVKINGVSKTLTIPSAPTTITGNAGTATTLQTARNLWGNSFNGSADINGTLDPGASSTSTVGTVAHPFASAVVGSFVKIGGCTEQWDATNKCLKFIFD